MLFNSLTFLIFLPIVFCLYWFAFGKSLRLQNLFVVAISYVFYGWWDARFLTLIAFTTLWAWVFGLLDRPQKGQEHGSKALLALSCVINLGILGVFKYYNFFTDSATALLTAIGFQVNAPMLKILLPVGISFYTFQALSYTIDIYRRKIEPTRDLIAFFAFVSFFPQLVAGPIERATNLLPQFLKPREFNFNQAMHGLCLIVYGLCKKIIVADMLAMYVNNAFERYEMYDSITLFIGAFFFAIQIYCDFSGYSDMARGIARLFGIELMINFNHPYFAKSIPDFWRRWHISLSTWFKDYLYFPLGGSRVSYLKLQRNLIVVFVVSGLWHGANWTFILWGALHAFYQCLAVTFQRIGQGSRLYNLVMNHGAWVHILWVNILVWFAWIFFRAESATHAFAYIKRMLGCHFNITLSTICAGCGPVMFGFMILATGLLFASEFLPLDVKFRRFSTQIIFIISCLFLVTFLGVASGGEFIYFQF